VCIVLALAVIGITVVAVNKKEAQKSRVSSLAGTSGSFCSDYRRKSATIDDGVRAAKALEDSDFGDEAQVQYATKDLHDLSAEAPSDMTGLLTTLEEKLKAHTGDPNELTTAYLELDTEVQLRCGLDLGS
jgi:hypothetical protein